jgi:hypothetical protein
VIASAAAGVGGIAGGIDQSSNFKIPVLIVGIEIETNELLVAVRCGDISRADLVAAVGGHRAPRAGRFRVPVHQGRGLGTARSDFPARNPAGIDRRRSAVRNEALTFKIPASRGALPMTVPCVVLDDLA